MKYWQTFGYVQFIIDSGEGLGKYWFTYTILTDS
jgi:hypothetical protein